MDIKILGAHNVESENTKHVSLLIDDVLAIEAGALTSSLTFPAQQKLRAVLLSHQHYDHVKDIPALGINFSMHENTIDIYSTRHVHEALSAHLLNDVVYPNYIEKPLEKPAIRVHTLEPGREEAIAGYSVLPVPVNHCVPTVGFQITSADGKSVFYTSDTGPGLAEGWQQVSPELLIIEVTEPDKYEEFAHRTGHLTPTLLQRELESFRDIKGYLPQVVLVHMDPLNEEVIKAEIAAVNKSLKTAIQFGYEGMQIHI